MIKEPLESVTGAGHRLGDFIRDQRRGNQISVRQLATLAGVSNPYLSQIERGLRKPSAEILQQIAKALRISAEALYVQAGILEQRQGSGAVADALLADSGLNERQKQVLLEIYDSFRRENGPESVTATTFAPPTSAPVSIDKVAPTAHARIGPAPSGAADTGPADTGPADTGPAPIRSRRTRTARTTRPETNHPEHQEPQEAAP